MRLVADDVEADDVGDTDAVRLVLVGGGRREAGSERDHDGNVRGVVRVAQGTALRSFVHGGRVRAGARVAQRRGPWTVRIRTPWAAPPPSTSRGSSGSGERVGDRRRVVAREFGSV